MSLAGNSDGECLFSKYTSALVERASTSHAALKAATDHPNADGADRKVGASSARSDAENSWHLILDGLPRTVPPADPALLLHDAKTASAHDEQHEPVEIPIGVPEGMMYRNLLQRYREDCAKSSDHAKEKFNEEGEEEEKEEEEDVPSQYDLSAQAIAVPMDWSNVLYLDNGKLDVLTVPVDPPSADFEFKGYDVAKDKSSVAAWFVRRGAAGPGTRRPNKGASGVNRAYHHGLWSAKNSDSSGYAAESFKRKHWHEYVPKKSRK